MGGGIGKEEKFEDPIFKDEIPFKKSISDDYNFCKPEYVKNSSYSVFKGFHIPTNADIVIKKIKKRKNKNEEEIKINFLRECAILKKIDNLNIVNCFEYFENDKFYYIVYSYLEGTALLDYFMKKKNKISDALTYEIIFELLKTFYYLEQNMIILRNWNFDNILYNGKVIKIVGFSKATLLKNTYQMLQTNYTEIIYQSPEMINGRYDNKTNSWFLGLLLYVLLLGKLPFTVDKNEKNQKKIIRKMTLNIDYLKKKKIHTDFITLLEMCLNNSSNKRASIHDLLETPIFKQKLVGKNILKEKGDSYFKSIKSYKSQNDFVKQFHQFFAEKLVKEEEKVELRAMFEEFDEDKNGHLTLEELKKGLEFTNLNIPNDEVEEIFKQCDLNKNGTLEFTEFYPALMSKKSFNKKEKLKQFFDFCDYDNTKTLKIEELNHILGIDIKKDKKTYACFKKIARKDNVLNFEEFYEFFNLLLDKK